MTEFMLMMLMLMHAILISWLEMLLLIFMSCSWYYVMLMMLCYAIALSIRVVPTCPLASPRFYDCVVRRDHQSSMRWYVYEWLDKVTHSPIVLVFFSSSLKTSFVLGVLLCSPKTSFVLSVPLGSPKTKDVPTGSQIVHV